MILSIKEAAALLTKMAKYVPDEDVELKFLEGLPVEVQPKKPKDILFAELVPGEPILRVNRPH